MSVQLTSWPPDLELDAADDLDEMARLLGRVLGVGTLIGGRYRLEAVVGRGGAATVWRARDELLDRGVALKILLPRPGRDPRDAQRRFLREARLCAAIRHPNVVDLLDYGTQDERPFLAMELLEGEALDTRLQREVQLDVSEAVAVAVGLLDGLHAAHCAGVIHRDLKPANVFLVSDGEYARPTLLDFGVSRSVDRALRLSALTTADGQLVGTPEYMSPEQARGSSTVDHRTDLYAAGVVLYECLAGVLPYESETVGELIVEIVTREPLPLTRIRSDLEPLADVLARAMAHRPEARFASAREMRDALLGAHTALRGGRPPEVRPYRAQARRVPAARRAAWPMVARPASPAPMSAPHSEPATAQRSAETPSEPTTQPWRAAPAGAPAAGARRVAARRKRPSHRGGASFLVGLALVCSGVGLGAWRATQHQPAPPVASDILPGRLVAEVERTATALAADGPQVFAAQPAPSEPAWTSPPRAPRPTAPPRVVLTSTQRSEQRSEAPPPIFRELDY